MVIKDLKVESKTLKFWEENFFQNLYNLGGEKDFWNQT